MKMDDLKAKIENINPNMIPGKYWGEPYREYAKILALREIAYQLASLNERLDEMGTVADGDSAAENTK